MEFLSRIGSFKTNLSSSLPNGPLGKIKLRELSASEKEVLSLAGLPISSNKISVFPRYRTNRLAVYSKECTRQDCVRNNSICTIRSDQDGPQFGSVETLCGVGGRHIAVVELFEKTNKGPLESLPPPHEEPNTPRINSFVYEVKKLSLSSRTVVVDVHKLLQKCVHIPIKHSPTDFIVTIPNTFELH